MLCSILVSILVLSLFKKLHMSSNTTRSGSIWMRSFWIGIMFADLNCFRAEFEACNPLNWLTLICLSVNKCWNVSVERCIVPYWHTQAPLSNVRCYYWYYGESDQLCCFVLSLIAINYQWLQDMYYHTTRCYVCWRWITSGCCGLAFLLRISKPQVTSSWIEYVVALNSKNTVDILVARRRPLQAVHMVVYLCPMDLTQYKKHISPRPRSHITIHNRTHLCSILLIP